MKKIETLEDALARIEELELENQKLNEELENYKNRKYAGRRLHDAKWQSRLRDFTVLHESGKSIMEIVETTGMSRRTVYRYKEYYDNMRNKSE